MSIILIVGGAPVVAQRHSVVNDCSLLLVTQTFYECVRLCSFKDKGKVKVKSICISPIHETSLRRSGIVRIVKGYHSFTCTLCISSASRMSHTCLCLPSRSWYSFTDPGGMEG